MDEIGSAHPSGPQVHRVRVMLSKQELYWANARECRRWAEKAKSEADRETLLEIAKVWTLLTLQKDLGSPIPVAQAGQRSKDQSDRG